MPDAPEQYISPSSKRSKDIEQLQSSQDTQRESGPNRYSHRRYRKFRARQKKKQRSIDEERVHEIYENLEERSFKDYISWLEDDNPLCVDCLEEGLIKPGRVMDHDTPIEQGGAVHDPDNLQWLCDHHHNVKRSTEDKQ